MYVFLPLWGRYYYGFWLFFLYSFWSPGVGVVLSAIFLITLHLSKTARESRPLYYFVIGGYTFGLALILTFVQLRVEFTLRVDDFFVPLIFIGAFGSSAVGILIAIHKLKPTDDPKQPLYGGMWFAFLI